MVPWVVGSILHGGSIELILMPAIVPLVYLRPYVLSCLLDNVYKSGGSGSLHSLSEWSFNIFLTPYNRQ